jgi:Zn-dependent protease
MFRSWRVGSAFGIPLYIHPTFLLIVPWVLSQSNGHTAFSAFFSVAVVLTIFACVLLHELGHALMARYFGIGTRDITLYPIGGVARLDRLSERPHEELCIALAGPAVNVVIAVLLVPVVLLGVFAGAQSGHMEELSLADGPLTILTSLSFAVLFANIGLVLFNMIPAFPMDGGRVFRAILAGPLGQVRATDIAARLGLVIAVVFAGLAIFLGQPFLLVISFFVAFVGHMERLAVRYKDAQRRAEAPVSVEPLSPEPHSAAPVYGETLTAATRGFSGVAWDGQYHVWVRWVDGRPVGYYAPSE